jgi:hypothetical protein
MYGYESLIGVSALAQENDSFHGIVAVNYRAVRSSNSFADLAQANLWTLQDCGNVLHTNRCTVLRLDQRLLDVRDIRK